MVPPIRMSARLAGGPAGTPVTAPPSPATKPATAKPWSFTLRTDTPKPRALSSLSRTATSSRANPLRRRFHVSTAAITSTPRTNQ